jgi:hypothetical protein
MKLEFLVRFSKNSQILIFMKMISVGAEMFRADGGTEMTKLITASRNFAKAPKNSWFLYLELASIHSTQRRPMY